MHLHDTIQEIFEIEGISEKLKINNIPLDTNKLVEVVCSQEPGRMSDKLGISNTTASKWLRKIFPDKNSTNTYLSHLLNKYDLKYCTSCDQVLESELFYRNLNRSDSLNTYCKICTNILASKTSCSRQAKYKASKIQRIPGWLSQEELQKISIFYSSCPPNMHVDHILPLQGELVSGLHVLDNLRYLDAVENIKKSNKFQPH